MGYIGSLAKSFKLRNISKRLDKDVEQALRGRGALSLLDVLSVRETAEEDLFELIESKRDLLLVMQTFAANRTTLKEAYDGLCQVCPQWTKGHWVPASALAFGPSLYYVLAKIREYEQNVGPISREDGDKYGFKHHVRQPGTLSTLEHPALPFTVGIRLTAYFERNETGSIFDE